VLSNVRSLQSLEYGVWRCGECQSLHATEPADLEAAYAVYPFHRVKRLNPVLRHLYGRLEKRLRKGGMTREQAVLDIGCGAGLLVEALQGRGYVGVQGYDRYSKAYNQPERLTTRWDGIIAQDVIEHVEEPLAWLDKVDELLKPGGWVSIGTPDAAAISLSRPAEVLHALHQPYHRHIFSRTALVAAAERRGWECVQVWDTMYSNSPIPFLNYRAVGVWLRAFDNTADALVRPGPFGGRFCLRLPSLLWWGLVGFWFAPPVDIQLLFRKSG